MIVRCHRCAGEAVVTVPFSLEPSIEYPGAVSGACQEREDQRARGHTQSEVEACQALQRAIRNAIAGRDD